MGVVFSVLVAILIAGFLWFYVVRPILEDYGLIGPRAVSYYQVDDPANVRITSRDASPITHPEPEPQGSGQFSLLNGEEPSDERSENPAELYLNAAEIAALHRMIDHNKTAAKPSKSSTIQAGFGVSRGGSTAYQRASLIYDTLFGTPAPAVKYRHMTPEQEALRKQLKLS